MDILYIVKQPTEELKYSLAGLDKFGSGIDRVFIVADNGRRPKFISDEVIYLQHSDIYDRKHKNILSAIEYTCLNTDISDEFLYSSDDHFYVRPTDFNNLPVYLKGELPTVPKNNGNYWKSMVETRELLERNGLPTLNYAQHCNTHIFKDVFINNYNLIQQTYRTEYGCEPTCIVLNCKSDLETVLRKDNKVDTGDVGDIRQVIRNNECVSSSDGRWSALKPELRMLYEGRPVRFMIGKL